MRRAVGCEALPPSETGDGTLWGSVVAGGNRWVEPCHGLEPRTIHLPQDRPDGARTCFLMSDGGEGEVPGSWGHPGGTGSAS